MPCSLRRSRRLSTGALVALFALVVLVAGGLAETAGAASAKVVVTPRARATVKRTPLPITIVAPYEARQLRVTLNGVVVTDAFSEPNRRHRRTLRASASDALRYGRNVLAVRMRVDGKLRRARIAFTVKRNRPLVGAGADRKAIAGRTVSLDGTASRPRTAPAPRPARRPGAVRSGGQPGSPAGLSFRWRLVSKPKGSRAALKVARPPLQRLTKQTKRSQRLQRLQPATPSLRADRPGRYKVALTVVDRGVPSLVDSVAITVVPATPLVPIDTAATVGGRRGIAVGYHPAQAGGRAPSGPSEAFYPRGSGNAFQLVVLDRRTLAYEGSYSAPAAAASLNTAAAAVQALDDSKLVIITAWADPGWAQAGIPTDTLTAPTGAAGQIGAPQTDYLFSPDPLLAGQTVTYAGVPGFPSGEAWQTGGVPGGTGLSTLNGFLSPDNNDNYAYLAGQPTTFDLGPDGQSVTLEIGGASYPASLPAGQGGFTAVYLNQATLTPAAGLGQQTYATGNADGTPNLSELNRMTGDLQKSLESTVPTLVAVRSIGPQPLAPMGGQPPAYAGTLDPAYVTALTQLTTVLASSGANAETVTRMATAPAAANSYSFVGSNSLLTGNSLTSAQGAGADIGTGQSPAPSAARLAGQLTRDHYQNYRPVGTGNAPVGGALLEAALAEPTAWPFTDTAAGNAAIACIGSQNDKLGANPRDAYWSQPNTGGDWGEIQDAVRELSPSACPSVAPELFKQVQAQLVKEIGWVVGVDSYVDSLTTPFTSNGLSSYAELRTITNTVVQAVTPPPRAPAGIDILMLFADIADLLDSFDVAAAGTISATFLITGDLWSSSQDGPTVDPGEKVVDAADQIGQTLATQLSDIAANNRALTNIVVADHAKLKLVGTLGGCVSGPGCTPEWQFSEDDQDAASRMYEVNANRQIWSGILPAGYPYALLTSSNTNAYNGTFEGPQEQISGIGCDFAQPFPVSTPVFLRYGVRQVGNTPFLVFSQTDLKGASSPSTNFPTARLLTPLFSPLDPGGDPTKGGLGLDQYDFMISNWTYTTATTRVPTPALKAWRGC